MRRLLEAFMSDYFFLAAIGFLAFTFVNLVLMTLRRKPGVPYMRGLLDSPNNIIFRPWDLTDSGLRARRRVFVGLLGFAVSLAIAIAAG
jgi:hypothetical protein